MHVELSTGVPTLHTRVDSWECDFNGHWNTRFYSRTVQQAAEVAAALGGQTDPDAVKPTHRHMRFHSELHSGDPIVVRSFSASSSKGEPLTAHVLVNHDRIAATGLDYGFAANPALPPLPTALAAQVMPRGVPDEDIAPWVLDPEGDGWVELGAVRAGETHRDGTLIYDLLIARLATTSHQGAMDIGYTHDFTMQSRIGRMLVEKRFTHLGTAAPGTFLRGTSRIISTTSKSFISANLIYTHAGDPVAMFELCTLAVNMDERKATTLPDFVAAAIRSPE